MDERAFVLTRETGNLVENSDFLNALPGDHLKVERRIGVLETLKAFKLFLPKADQVAFGEQAFGWKTGWKPL